MNVNTTCWTMTEADISEESAALEEAADLLRRGELVAFPTETVYGLGADARNGAAVSAIYEAKGRPSDNPLIVHVASAEQADELVAAMNETERRLAGALWPGALTLVLPCRPGAVDARVTAGLPTVAVRVPDHALARRLIAASGCPIAAPSANRSGRPSPTTAQHVLDDLAGRIAGVVDGGPTGIGLESTVVRVSADGRRIHVLRPGGVTAAALAAASPGAEVVGPGTAELRADEAPASPGVKYAHYAPKGRLTLVSSRAGGAQAAADYIRGELKRLKSLGEVAGVLSYSAERASRCYAAADVVVVCGSEAEGAESIARGLYGALRAFDEAGATAILAETIADDGLGGAVMNRLRKAASGNIMEI